MFTHLAAFTHTTPEGITLKGVTGGNGPPLLLLHGYPQTHVMWHKAAPLLERHFTLIIPDLRGYGASSKPPTTADHAPYSKRAMAQDMVHLMTHFGYDQFAIVAHDRGARVAHRLGMDHPNRVTKMTLLDIAPTREMYANTTDGFARAYWHWFFLIQDAPFPENMIAANPRAYVHKKCGAWSAGASPIASEAMAYYVQAFEDPATIHACCEDYRAAASIDIAHDNADGDRKLTAPLQVLWGAHGAIEAHFDCLALWRQRAENVIGHRLPAGHYLAEEVPEMVVRDVLAFHGDA
jgi:haloacetate dehalogenase